MAKTYVDKQICTAGYGDFIEYWICASEDGSVIAKTYDEYLATVIQAAIEKNI